MSERPDGREMSKLILQLVVTCVIAVIVLVAMAWSVAGGFRV